MPDTINGVLEYPEGFAVNLSSTFNNESGGAQGIQILGTKGTLTIGDGLTFTPEVAEEDNRWIVDSWPRELEEAYYKDPKVRATELPGMRPQRVIPASEHYRAEGVDSTVVHLSNFVTAIRTRKSWWEEPVEGHHAAACAHMVNQAAREGRVVQWNTDRDDIA